MSYSSRDLGRFRKRIQAELAKNPLWTVIANNSKWFCPYCGKESISGWPADNAQTQCELILQHFVKKCNEWQAFKGKLRSAKEMGRKRMLRELRSRAKRSVVRKKEWQFSDVERHWYCPFCASESKVRIPKNRTMTEQTLKGIVDHIDSCYAFKKRKGKEQSLDHITKMVTKGNQKKSIATETRASFEKGLEVWLQRTKTGDWICPFCYESLTRCDITSPLFLRENAPKMVAEHLVDVCRKYKTGTEPSFKDGRDAEKAPLMAFQSEEDDTLEIPVLRGLTEEDSGDGLLSLEGPPKTGKKTGAWGRDGDLAALDHGVTLEAFERSGEVDFIDDQDLPDSFRANKKTTQRRSSISFADWREDIDAEIVRRAPKTSKMPRNGAGRTREFVWAASIPKVPCYEISCAVTKGKGNTRDFVDTISIGPLLFFAVGSISQKDEDPQQVAQKVQRLLRLHTRATTDPAEILKLVNGDVFGELRPNTFVNLMCFFLDPRPGRVSYSRAGLLPPILVRPKTKQHTRLQDYEGMVIGADSGPLFDPTVATSRLQMETGDLLVLHSNGIFEVRNRRREPWGPRRFEQAVLRYGRHEAEYFTDKLKEKVDLFSREEVPSSDFAVLALKRLEGQTAYSWSG